jgi:lincosamide nucleotidyltransferase A/C/D/E
MMNEVDAVDLLKKAGQIGVDVWISGGWGVDTVVGRQTRPHNDIDIFVQKKDARAFTEMLRLNGYRETKMEYTTNDHTGWCNPDNCTIDLHLFEFAEAGTLRFENETYPSDVLNGTGTIGGITVRCLTAEAQLLYHQGYEQTEKDRHDVLLLCKTFGLSIPEEYIEKPLVNKEYLLEKFPGKGGWTYTVIPEIPPDKKAPFGWVKVRGSIDGFEISKYHLMPSGKGDLILFAKSEIRKKIKKQAGD